MYGNAVIHTVRGDTYCWTSCALLVVPLGTDARDHHEVTRVGV